MGLLIMWTSRKFISAWGLTLIATGLVIYGSIGDVAWSGTISIIWAAYFAANVATKSVLK